MTFIHNLNLEDLIQNKKGLIFLGQDFKNPAIVNALRTYLACKTFKRGLAVPFAGWQVQYKLRVRTIRKPYGKTLFDLE